MGYSPDVQTSTVISTVITNVFGGAALYLLFEKFRSNREIFMPRMRTDKDLTPSPPPEEFGAWIFSTEKIDEKDTLGYIGSFLIPFH
jgi:hypothetical protein